MLFDHSIALYLDNELVNKAHSAPNIPSTRSLSLHDPISAGREQTLCLSKADVICTDGFLRRRVLLFLSALAPNNTYGRLAG